MDFGLDAGPMRLEVDPHTAIGIRRGNPALDEWYGSVFARSVTLVLDEGQESLEPPPFVDGASATSSTFAANRPARAEA